MTSFLPRMRSTPELRGRNLLLVLSNYIEGVQKKMHPLKRTLYLTVTMVIVGQAGLEPAKANASGFTVRPLCHSGH